MHFMENNEILDTVMFFIFILNYNVVDIFVTLDHKTRTHKKVRFIHHLKAE